ncbi:MAG: hypothetical protein LBF21_02385 [Puniceicoccales bacterium]|jgi:hypothetical protein|nr:hypothetical protein [Puniceicoccales bacterium]
MWSLTYQNQRRSFADWGISRATRVLKNQATDTLTLERDGEYPGAFAFGEPIRIHRGEELWFQGIVTETPSFDRARKAHQRCIISGPWWFLEQTIYQQKWKESSDTSSEDSPLQDVYKSHLILGQDENGQALSLGQQIGDVLAYLSQEAGVAIALDPQLDLPIFIPYDECKDLSCAEVIRRLLRWAPDTVSFFDYTGETPCLYLKRQSQLEALSLDLKDPRLGLQELRVRPRHDLQIPAVVLKFEKTHTVNGRVWSTLETQAWPAGADGTAPRSLVMTIELEGSRATYVRQKIGSEPIDLHSVSWWKAHLPGLENISAEAITVEEAERTGELPRELTEGSVASWMNASAETALIQARISYTSDEESVYRKRVTVKLRTTDALPKTYQFLSAYTSEEDAPSGLAEQLYAGVSPLTFEGQLHLETREVSGHPMGKKLNLLGGDTAWATMQAAVQEVTEELGSGRTQIRFGPAQHLGAADLVELTRSNRHRFSVRNALARSSGEAEGSGCVEQGKSAPLENTAYGPGKYQKMIFIHPEAPTARSITIDASALSRDLSVQLREENVCESGLVKKRLSLASEAFLEESSDSTPEESSDSNTTGS